MDAVKSPKSSSSRISLNIPIPPIFSKSFSSLSSPRTPAKSPANSITISPPRRSSGSREGEFREVFKRFDTDNDGRISAYELRAYFGSVGEHMSHEEAEAAIGVLDADGDGLIDFQDFLKLMQRDDDGEDDADLKAAFEMFEFGKGSGRITPKSLQKVLNWLGEPKSYDECVTMIKVYDIDGNGELDFHEFRQMMAA